MAKKGYDPSQPRAPRGTDIGGQWTATQIPIDFEAALRAGAGLKPTPHRGTDLMNRYLKTRLNPYGKSVQEENEANRKRLKTEYGYTEAELVQLEDTMKKDFRNSRISVTIEHDNLEGVIKDGKIKNQFETLRSSGMYDPRYRKRAEEKIFGVPEIEPAANRPIYGAINNTAVNHASGYGEFEFVLSDKAVERTSYTIDDSLNYEDYLRGEPILKPSAGSLLAHGGRGGMEKQYMDERFDAILNHAFGYGEGNNGEFLEAPWPYIEAQIFGGVNLETDVEYIIVDNQKEFDFAERIGKIHGVDLPLVIRSEYFTLED